jgi:hypothetical protein
VSTGFRAVQWNRAKLAYDGILLAGVVIYIGGYLLLAYRLDPPKDQPAAIDLRIRAFGTCAFLMLTIILSIGPLARLDRRFLPLLYNRRSIADCACLISLARSWYLAPVAGVSFAVGFAGFVLSSFLFEPLGLVYLPNGRLRCRGSADIASDDSGNVFLLPPHDLGNHALAQAGGVESRRRRPSQIVEVQVTLRHTRHVLCADKGTGEELRPPGLMPAVGQNRGRALGDLLEHVAQGIVERNDRLALVVALARCDDDRVFANMRPRQPNEITKAEAGMCRKVERQDYLRRAHPFDLRHVSVGPNRLGSVAAVEQLDALAGIARELSERIHGV